MIHCDNSSQNRKIELKNKLFKATSKNKWYVLVFISFIVVSAFIANIFGDFMPYDSYFGSLKSITNKNQITDLAPKNQEIVLKKPNINYYLETIIKNKNPRIDPIIVSKIAETTIKYALQYNIPPELILSIIHVESSFKQDSISSANCIGLMQINPTMHVEKLKNISNNELYHIDNNIKIGCLIFKEYFTQTKSIEKTLTKYLGENNQEYINKILICFTDMLLIDKNQCNFVKP